MAKYPICVLMYCHYSLLYPFCLQRNPVILFVPEILLELDVVRLSVLYNEYITERNEECQ